MKKIFYLLFPLATSLAASAQQGGSIKGTVTDAGAKPLEAATVSLHRAKDSAVIKLAVPSKEGTYSFDVAQDGSYLISASAVGYSKKFSSPVTVSSANPQVTVAPLQMELGNSTLGAVTVVSKRPLVEQKIDRTIVNVEASVTNAGSNAMEVLEKSPGITVDRDGNISLKGKAGVMVLVDGRPTQLGASELANLLRSMQASDMDQIEIMTNPPAKYDAAGTAGVINIKTKKIKQTGYNGSVNLGAGYGLHARSNAGINFNYRKNKMNLFANFSHNYRKTEQRLSIQRNFLEPATENLLFRFEQQANMINESNSINGKVGIDYSLSKKTSIGATIGGFTNPGVFTNNGTINRLVQGNLTEQTLSNMHTDRSFYSVNSNLNFRHQINKEGRELTADLDFMKYDGLSDLTLRNDFMDKDGKMLRKGDTLLGGLPQIIDIYSGRVDYVHPLKKGARLEAGVKSSYVQSDNNARYDTLLMGAQMQDKSRSNHFVYQEQINAAYLNLSQPLTKKWTAQAGLRLENTTGKGHSDGFSKDTASGQFLPADTSFKINYTQLFPTLYLQYKSDDKNSFVINYARRLRRPDYESLNPFIEFLDRYTYEQGNPNLKPQFSHNIELSHTFKGFLTTTLNYTSTNNIITQVIEQNEERSEAYVRQANIAKQKQYGVAVSANMPINKWWTSNVYVNVFNNHFDGLVNNIPISFDQVTLQLNGSQQFKLNKKLTAELSGWYRTAGIDGVVFIRPVGMLSAGLSQQVIKGKGSLRLNVQDLFSTGHWYGRSRYGNVDVAFQNINDSRAVRLTFNYRFNKGKANGGPQRKVRESEEAGRVKQG